VVLHHQTHSPNPYRLGVFVCGIAKPRGESPDSACATVFCTCRKSGQVCLSFALFSLKTTTNSPSKAHAEAFKYQRLRRALKRSVLHMAWMGRASNQRIFSTRHGIQPLAFVGNDKGAVGKQRPMRFGFVFVARLDLEDVNQLVTLQPRSVHDSLG
jgi:hypothetical protein